MNDPLTPMEKPRPGMDHFQFKPTAGMTVPPLNAATALVDESGKRKSFVGTVRSTHGPRTPSDI